MFDIGFSELMVIAVVALIVIGPERLPKVARTLGHLFGRMQRYVNDVKSDISREMELEELKKLQNSIQETARSIEQSVNQEISSTESQLNDIAATANETTPMTASANSEALLITPAATGATPTAEAAAVPAAAPAATPTPQLELGLEATNLPARTQA